MSASGTTRWGTARGHRWLGDMYLTKERGIRRLCRGYCYIRALMLAIVTSSCTHAFEVSKGSEGTKGIPFFLKKEVLRQHTTYEYSWIRVVLTQEPISNAQEAAGDKANHGIQSVREVIDNDANRKSIDDIEVLLATLPLQKPTRANEILIEIRHTFAALADVSATGLKYPVPSDLRVLSNYVERIPSVDYGTVYYLNGKIPPFGSNNLSAELAPDGTLSKSSSDATGYLKGVASEVEELFPVKEYATAAWVPKSTGENATSWRNEILGQKPLGQIVDSTTLAFRVILDTEQQTTTFDFTKDLTAIPTGDSLEHVKVDFKEGTFTSRQGALSSGKASSDGISFSGKVELPASKKP